MPVLRRRAKPRSPPVVSDPKALETWSKTQLKKITGSDDLTLVHFCMTLADSSEIRQYLSLYLGSTPQVAAFANEFIQRKSGKADTKATTISTAPRQAVRDLRVPGAVCAGKFYRCCLGWGSWGRAGQDRDVGYLLATDPHWMFIKSFRIQ